MGLASPSSDPKFVSASSEPRLDWPGAEEGAEEAQGELSSSLGGGIILCRLVGAISFGLLTN